MVYFGSNLSSLFFITGHIKDDTQTMGCQPMATNQPIFENMPNDNTAGPPILPVQTQTSSHLSIGRSQNQMESRPVLDHAITRQTGVSSGQVRIGMNMYSEVYNNRFKETIHQNQMNSHYRYEHEATREFAPSTEQVQNLQIYLWEGYKYWF